ncbi:MAG: hypothetical protein A2Y17_00675 [Clostridiales bacterium GWF2_38_85]|nr:MAG: hypothetical protein A2Y17_00675 [Clostridiales bacterium GWF2_38_85]
MKSDEIIVKIDELGRILIPLYIRREMCIDTKTILNLNYNNKKQTLQISKTHETCCICGIPENLIPIGESKLKICKDCLKHLAYFNE